MVQMKNDAPPPEKNCPQPKDQEREDYQDNLDNSGPTPAKEHGKNSNPYPHPCQ